MMLSFRAARGVLLGACLAALMAPAPSLTAQVPAHRPPGLDLSVAQETLPNGLRVLALRRPGAPVASFVLRFDIGSVNEGAGETGIAHFLEHLLFKGTTTIGTTNLSRERALFARMDAAHDTLLALRASLVPADPLAVEAAEPADEAAEAARLRARIRALEDSARAYVDPAAWDRILTQSGAQEQNATTGYESTEYFVRLPSNRAELWFVLEADRMANPVLREFYAERDVIVEERLQRVDASPSGRLMEEFYAAAYRVHPYGVPVVGHMADIRSYSRARVREYHDRYYRPNNAVVAVVGDVDPAQIMAWARQYFGAIPAGDVPAPVLAAEPAQRGERRVEVVFDADPALMIGWHVPAARARDGPAVAMLGHILAGGRTSRLYRRLVLDDHVAASISFSLGPGARYPQLFTLSAQPLHGRTVAEVEAAVYEEIERLAAEAPTEHELRRVRNQLEVGDVGRLVSDLGLAFQLAASVAIDGDWRETFHYGQRLARVTPADIQRVAREYLDRENRTVAVRTRGEP